VIATVIEQRIYDISCLQMSGPIGHTN